jgi:hypothetical protein
MRLSFAISSSDILVILFEMSAINSGRLVVNSSSWRGMTAMLNKTPLDVSFLIARILSVRVMEWVVDEGFTACSS